ncbi:MAG: hypothetical protein EOP35_25865 [Rubrivivax sp.]|nr:MAG: hypothetical protein EOP35_25865 [Rubrivivax sp.]
MHAERSFPTNTPRLAAGDGASLPLRRPGGSPKVGCCAGERVRGSGAPRQGRPQPNGSAGSMSSVASAVTKATLLIDPADPFGWGLP